jgi:hypothetical protein
VVLDVAKRNQFVIDGNFLYDYAKRLDNVGKNVEKVIMESLESIGEDVGVDTYEAMDKENLPALGDYSLDKTIETVIRNPKPVIRGYNVEIGLGFDKTKNGAGTLLITGTPRMQPNRELERMFVRKQYNKEVNSRLMESIEDLIKDELGG